LKTSEAYFKITLFACSLTQLTNQKQVFKRAV